MTTRRTWSDEMADANYPLGPLVDDWLLIYQAAGKSTETITTYRHLLAGFMAWFETAFSREAHAADLGDGDNGRRLVERFLRERRRDQRKANTLNTTLSALRQFAEWAHTSGFLTADTVKQVGWVKRPDRMVHTLTDDDLTRIEAAIATSLQPKRDELLFRLLLGTGLRRAELANLRRDGATTRDARGRPLLYGQLRVIGKGDKERTVGMGKGDTAILRRWLETPPDKGGRPEPASEDDAPYVLLTRDGRRIEPDAITALVAGWKRKTGIGYLHAHLFRHTFATEFLLTRGPDGEYGRIETLSTILGHASIQQTQVYTHLQHRAEVVEQHQRTSPTDARDERKRSASLSGKRGTKRGQVGQHRAQSQASGRGA